MALNSNQVTEQVRKLYDTVSYSAYNEDYFPVVKSLGLSRENLAEFAKGKQALEIGCGGGQLTVFLAGFFAKVTAVDISLQSLIKAKAQAQERHCTNIEFAEGNLFDDAFVAAHANKYDYVLCYGVLHHTADPTAGFARLVKLLKPGGVLTVGVYSRTQWLYRLKRKLVLLLAGDDWDKRKKIAEKLFFKNGSNSVAIFDGYVHPQVSFHSVGQVYGWVFKNGLDLIGAWPPIGLWAYGRAIRKRPAQACLPRRFLAVQFWLVELFWLIRGKSVMVSLSAKKSLH